MAPQCGYFFRENRANCPYVLHMLYRGVGLFLLFSVLPAWALDKALVDELAKLPTQKERKQ